MTAHQVYLGKYKRKMTPGGQEEELVMLIQGKPLMSEDRAGGQGVGGNRQKGGRKREKEAPDVHTMQPTWPQMW